MNYLITLECNPSLDDLGSEGYMAIFALCSASLAGYAQNWTHHFESDRNICSSTLWASCSLMYLEGTCLVLWGSGLGGKKYLIVFSWEEQEFGNAYMFPVLLRFPLWWPYPTLNYALSLLHVAFDFLFNVISPVSVAAMPNGSENIHMIEECTEPLSIKPVSWNWSEAARKG